MYRKDSEKWLKHFDFIALDMICLQLAFMFAYAIRGYGMNVYGDVLYRNMAIFLGLADLVVIFMVGTMKKCVEKRSLQRVCINVKSGCYSGRTCNCVSVYDSGGTEFFKNDSDYHCGHLLISNLYHKRIMEKIFT